MFLYQPLDSIKSPKMNRSFIIQETPNGSRIPANLNGNFQKGKVPGGHILLELFFEVFHV